MTSSVLSQFQRTSLLARRSCSSLPPPRAANVAVPSHAGSTLLVSGSITAIVLLLLLAVAELDPTADAKSVSLGSADTTALLVQSVIWLSPVLRAALAP